MSWATLAESIVRIPNQGERSLPPLLQEVVDADPSIYWYPGSADDLSPLVLDVPNNPVGERLFPLIGPEQERSLVLWMNDRHTDYSNFPIGWGSAGPHGFNQELWPQLGAHANFEGVIEQADLLIADNGVIPVSIFQVRVTNQIAPEPRDRQYLQRYQRDDDGDLYTVLYSPAESELLLRNVFVPNELHIHTVALIRQGGFSCGRHDFDHYTDLPFALEELAPVLGPVHYYLLDREDVPDDVRIPGFRSTGLSGPDWGAFPSTLWERNVSTI